MSGHRSLFLSTKSLKWSMLIWERWYALLNKDKKVYFNTDISMNNHMLLLGKSGSGKTVQAQKLMIEIVKQGGTVVAVDMHQTLSGNQIFWKYKEDFNKYLTEIDAYQNGICCNFFEPLVYADGVQEHLSDTVDAVTNVLGRTLNLGMSQQAVLRTAVGYVAQEGGFEREGFRAIDHALARMGSKVADGIAERLHQLSAHNIFRSGQWFAQKGHINVVRLGRFSLGTQELVAEMLLSYLWRLAMAGRLIEGGLYAFVDECQSLLSGKNSSLAQILSEGRKFNLNIILATQQLLQGSASVVQQRLTQCGMILLFQPDVNRVNQIAKMVDVASTGEWRLMLRNLKQGEFVTHGALMVGGSIVEYPIRVSAYEAAETKNAKGVLVN